MTLHWYQSIYFNFGTPERIIKLQVPLYHQAIQTEFSYQTSTVACIASSVQYQNIYATLHDYINDSGKKKKGSWRIMR